MTGSLSPPSPPPPSSSLPQSPRAPAHWAHNTHQCAAAERADYRPSGVLDRLKAALPEAVRIRGYQLARHEERVLNFLEPGSYLVTE